MAIDESRAFKPINIALLTVSDTRGPDEDTSGDILAERITAPATSSPRGRSSATTPTRSRAVQQLDRRSGDRRDRLDRRHRADRARRDARGARRVKDKDIEGFGELFRWISYQTIGTSTVQSRACAAVARGTYLFALPGSNGAVKDGWDRILAEQLDSRNRPCNFVELMPRLRET
jgi:molybdenum cofactor biosynthesis protein B